MHASCSSFMQTHYSVTFCRLPEVAGEVISGSFVRQVAFDNDATFSHPLLRRSRHNRLTDVGIGFLTDAFVALTYYRKYS